MTFNPRQAKPIPNILPRGSEAAIQLTGVAHKMGSDSIANKRFWPKALRYTSAIPVRHHLDVYAIN